MIPDPSMVLTFAVHVCVSLVVAFVLLARARAPLSLRDGALILAGTALASFGIGLLTAPTPGGFAKLLVWSWTLAVVLPTTAFAIAVRAGPVLPVRLAFLAVGLLGGLLAVDAFVWEPRNLEISHHEVISDRLDAPLRIAVIADLQTDVPGDHERAALQAVLAAKPDVILFAGDVIQHHDEAAYAHAWSTLQGIAAPLQLDAPLGVYMVEGDSEFPHATWAPKAESLGMTVLPDAPVSRALRDDVTLTGMGLRASARTDLSIERPDERFHVVFGHRPAFALGDIDAELLLAGHTHGGQVQVPGWGPLLTLSKVPRSWASGRTELGGERTLIVSRGVGMERAVAPRIRFWCRPEVVIVDVRPPA
ncbi:MAG: metallophosphoesterase [Myxococcota bacterium]